MYSVVLLVAVSSGAEVADFGHRRGHGCRGGCYGGGGSYGCSGSGWGCGGGGCYGGGGSYGCSGSGWGCYGGGGSYGCSGSGWGCGGGYSPSYSGSWGCSGGYAAGYGCGGSAASYGGYSAGYGCGGYAASYGGGYASGYGCGGSVAGYGGSVPSYGCGGGVAAPATPPQELGTGEQVGRSSAPATLVVQLPADAQLSIDSQPTRSASERRVFVTPSLAAGKSYRYTLQAEVRRDGKPVRWRQEVTVRAGQTTRVTLRPPATAYVRR